MRPMRQMNPKTTLRRSASRLAFLCLPLMGLGCVPQDRYDQLLTANRSLKEQIVALEDDRDEARASVRSLQDQISGLRTSYDGLESQNSELNMAIDSMESANESNLRRIAQLELGPLPAEIASAIEDLAVAHPDVLSFDARLGMLRFASDFTFDLGSVALKEDAQATLDALAAILSADAARGIEARVVGHTDNVPIGKPETRRLHPTNVHLSVHRAISVRDALVAAGVDAGRILVAGYGEYRPIVENGRRGAAENRRVEIFLAPMSADGTSSPAPEMPAAQPLARPVEPMK